MNQLLKFRVWVPAERKMYPVSSVHLDQVHRIGMEVFVDNPNCNMEDYIAKLTRGEKNDIQPILTYNEKEDNIVIMQCVGFKDQNGIEIYEGDLVAEIDKIEELEKWGKPLTVEFGQFTTDKDSCGLENHTTGFFLRYNDSDNATTGIHDKESGYGFKGSNLLIVGNIYETNS